jgi:hypothetical protein
MRELAVLPEADLSRCPKWAWSRAKKICLGPVTRVTAAYRDQHQSSWVELPRERPMPRSTLNSNPPKWVLALYREMQTSIGHQFQMECKLPDELAPDLSALVARLDEEVVGTC